MNIIIAGASGFVGRMLVNRLAQSGCELLLAGRNVDDLRRMFPEYAAVGYNELPDVKPGGFDLFINLAAKNNDTSGDLAAFERANSSFVEELLEVARGLGIPRFVHFSSLHALDHGNETSYAVSKRKGDAVIKAAHGIDAITLHLPMVYGDAFSGKLARLNSLPRPIAKVAFHALAALKPTVHVDIVAAHILTGSGGAILSDGQRRNPLYRLMQVSVDWAFALSILIFFWWLLLILWTVVALSSPGPGFFIQERIGQHGRIFRLYKFRTMALGTKQAGTHETSAASITKVGAFLRRSKLDELPQILNILKGELSLIGPRPCLPSQVELVEARKRRNVLTLRPGISGLAQVEGLDMSNPVRLAKRDADYLAMQCLTLDLKIAIATAKGRGQGDRISR